MTLTDLQPQFDIDASASRVWSVLSDLDRYAEWNPWLRVDAGRLEAGTTLELTVCRPDRDTEQIEVVVERVSPISTIVVRHDWPDVPGRSTLHEFRLEPIRTGTRVHQVHTVISPGTDGDPAPFHDRSRLALEMMNAALKARAER